MPVDFTVTEDMLDRAWAAATLVCPALADLDIVRTLVYAHTAARGTFKNSLRNRTYQSSGSFVFDPIGMARTIVAPQCAVSRLLHQSARDNAELYGLQHELNQLDSASTRFAAGRLSEEEYRRACLTAVKELYAAVTLLLDREAERRELLGAFLGGLSQQGRLEFNAQVRGLDVSEKSFRAIAAALPASAAIARSRTKVLCWPLTYQEAVFEVFHPALIRDAKPGYNDLLVSFYKFAAQASLVNVTTATAIFGGILVADPAARAVADTWGLLENAWGPGCTWSEFREPDEPELSRKQTDAMERFAARFEGTGLTRTTVDGRHTFVGDALRDLPHYGPAIIALIDTFAAWSGGDMDADTWEGHARAGGVAMFAPGLGREPGDTEGDVAGARRIRSLTSPGLMSVLRAALNLSRWEEVVVVPTFEPIDDGAPLDDERRYRAAPDGLHALFTTLVEQSARARAEGPGKWISFRADGREVLRADTDALPRTFAFTARVPTDTFSIVTDTTHLDDGEVVLAAFGLREYADDFPMTVEETFADGTTVTLDVSLDDDGIFNFSGRFDKQVVQLADWRRRPLPLAATAAAIAAAAAILVFLSWTALWGAGVAEDVPDVVTSTPESTDDGGTKQDAAPSGGSAVDSVDPVPPQTVPYGKNADRAALPSPPRVSVIRDGTRSIRIVGGQAVNLPSDDPALSSAISSMLNGEERTSDGAVEVLGPDNTSSHIRNEPTAVRESLPTIRWSDTGPVDLITARIRDGRIEPATVTKGVSGGSLELPSPLEYGVPLQWQAVRDGRVLEEGRIHLLEPDGARLVEAAERISPVSHVARAAAYLEVGLRDEFRRELDTLRRDNPDSRVLRRLDRATRRPQ